MSDAAPLSRAPFPWSPTSYLRERRETWLAMALLSALLAVSAILNPAWIAPDAWGTVIGLAGPLIAASIASMPSILGGRGGIDVSIGPLMGFINVVIVKSLMTDLGISSPTIIVFAALSIGAVVGRRKWRARNRCSHPTDHRDARNLSGPQWRDAHAAAGTRRLRPRVDKKSGGRIFDSASGCDGGPMAGDQTVERL